MKNFHSHSEVAGFEKFNNSNKKRDGKKQINKANKTVRGNKVMFLEHYM